MKASGHSPEAKFTCLPRQPAVAYLFLVAFCRVADLDYARLKRSFEYFVEHYASAESLRLGHPIKLLERDDPSPMSWHAALPLWRLQTWSMAHRIFAANVSRRLIATYTSETVTRYPFCVSTSQGELKWI